MKSEQNETGNIKPEMQLENLQKDVQEKTPEDIECPKSPLPNKFELPTPPNSDYYKDKVSKDQLSQIEGIKAKDLNAASEKKDDEIAAADDTYQTAKSAFDKATRDKENAIKSLKTKSKNKKIELLRVYQEKLVGLLPKGCATGKEGAPIEERVPADKVAICKAELNKSLADEDIDYLKKLKDIKDKLADAKNLWEKAINGYESAVCVAKLTEEQAIKQADVVKLTSISSAMEASK